MQYFHVLLKHKQVRTYLNMLEIVYVFMIHENIRIHYDYDKHETFVLYISSCNIFMYY